jgi:hypothetical protein
MTLVSLDSTRTSSATAAQVWLKNGGTEGDLMTELGWSSRVMVDRYAKSAQVEPAHEAAKRMSLGDRV